MISSGGNTSTGSEKVHGKTLMNFYEKMSTHQTERGLPGLESSFIIRL